MELRGFLSDQWHAFVRLKSWLCRDIKAGVQKGGVLHSLIHFKSISPNLGLDRAGRSSSGSRAKHSRGVADRADVCHLLSSTPPSSHETVETNGIQPHGPDQPLWGLFEVSRA